jgi:hypothetical protein
MTKWMREPSAEELRAARISARVKALIVNALEAAAAENNRRAPPRLSPIACEILRAAARYRQRRGEAFAPAASQLTSATAHPTSATIAAARATTASSK